MNPPEEPQVYAFDGFELDARRRRLYRKGGERVLLPPKVFDTLAYLVARPGELIATDELMAAIWPNRVVEENNLSQAISALRRVFGERPGEHRFIVTEPRRGYRFVASVQVQSSGCELKLHRRRLHHSPTATLALISLAAFAVVLWISYRGNDPSIDSPIVVDATNNPEVLNLVSRAEQILRTGLRDSLPAAREMLERAVGLDPNFFPTHELLIQIYFNSGEVGLLTPLERERLVTETIARAARIWPDRAEIIIWRAFVAFRLHNDYQAAADYLERVLVKDPGNVDALSVASNLTYVLNRPKTVIEIERYLLGQEPICFDCYQRLTSAYIRDEQYEKVEETYEEALELGIDEASLRSSYAQSLLLRGKADRALREFQDIRGENTHVMKLTGSAMALYSLNLTAEFEETFESLKALPLPSSLAVASVYAYINDLDSAFELLVNEPELPIEWFDGPMKVMRDYTHWDALAEKAGAWPSDPREAVRFEVALPN